MQHTQIIQLSPSQTAGLRDLVGNAPLQASANTAMSVADAIQHTPHKGARLMGAACTFLLMAEGAGLSVTDLVLMARNCMNTAEGRRPEFAAVSEFVCNEVLHNSPQSEGAYHHGRIR